MKITLHRIDDAFHFEAKNEQGNIVYMDADEKIGGHNRGARPMQLLLMALAGCSAIDMTSILKKQKQKIDDFRIEVEGERESGEGNHAKVFADIKVHFFLSGDIEPGKAKRAAELSMEKYCSASKTLRLAGAKIKYQVSVNEQSVQSRRC